MKFYRYWARGEAPFPPSEAGGRLRAFGYSDASLEDARRNAEETARRVADAFRKDGPLGAYGYADRPLREDIVEEVGTDGDGRPRAVITRNSYGCLVLNTERAFFADIDYPQQSSIGGLSRMLGRLFGKPPPPDRDEEILGRVHDCLRADRSLGLRIYRTAGGYRCLLTHRPYEPDSDATDRLLAALGADPLYVRLCRAQECFRARLTPKYWRCGGTRPPSRFPWGSEDEEREFRRWQEDYQRLTTRYATCSLVGAVGESAIHPDVAEALSIHDRFSLRGGCPLA